MRSARFLFLIATGVVAFLALLTNASAAAAEQGGPPAWKVAENFSLIPTPQQIPDTVAD